MADQGSPGQSAPVAAPAPARDRREPGHGLTEAQFWADEGAPAIGGQYGIPNGLIAAAAAAPPGAPDDVGSMFGRLDARRARGLALQLQRTAGNAHLRAVIAASRLAADATPGNGPHDAARNGRANGHVVQRQPPASTVPPPPPGSSTSPPTSPEEQEKLEKEDREFHTLSSVGGTVEVWLENPRMVLQGVKEKRVETLTIQSLLPRSSEPDQRKGWDQPGPALAFVVAMTGGQGGAVLKGETGFFAAVGSGAGSMTRDKVFQVRPTATISQVVGMDGFAYAPGQIYEPDASRGEAKLDPSAKDMAGTASAADLARIAGIQRPEDKNQADAGAVRPTEIPEAQVRSFLRQYMVARAVEILDANAAHARKEMEEFRGAPVGQPATTAIPESAKKKIDKARDMGKKFSKLIEMERELEDLEAQVGRRQSTGGGSRQLVELKGKRLRVETWRKRIANARQILASGKSQILSENPMIAQLVDPRIGREEWAMQARELMKLANPFYGDQAVNAWDRTTGTDNPFNRSELAKPSSPESDQKARDDYVKKLDGVLKAVGEVKAKVLAGDERYLFSLPGLGQRVRGELKSISGKNAKLGEQLEKIVADLGSSAADIAATVVSVAGLVLQLAGFFFPPLLFVGAVMSFGASAYNMDKALDKLQVSQAAVTPEEAMVDPAEAQAAMIDHTLDLAMQAITVGMEVGSALEALEAGRAKDLEKLAAKGEPKPKEVPEPKPGEPPKTADPAPAPQGTGGSGAAGAVDPRMTTKTGLAGADAVRKHTEAMAKVAEEWTAASPVQRAFLLQGRAQGAAAEAGIPHNIIVTPDAALKGYKGAWHADGFSIHVSHDVLNNATADMAQISEIIYHETRHAEQTWQMARMRASMGEDAQAIARKFGIPQELAEKAVLQKLATNSEEYRAAFRWYESMFGAGAARRTELLKPGGLLQTAETRTQSLEAAYNKLRADPTTPHSDLLKAHQDWSKSWLDWKALDNEYRQLPEEVDAYLVGGRAKAQFDLTNPGAAPVTQRNP